EAHPGELAGTEGAAADAIVEIDHAERLAARDQRHGENAAELERVHALVHLGQVAGGVHGDDGLALREGSPRERLAELELWPGQIGAQEIARGTRTELVARRTKQEQPALDAGPQHEGVHHLLEQRLEAIAPP